jgi:hypothetical protein
MDGSGITGSAPRMDEGGGQSGGRPPVKTPFDTDDTRTTS